MNLFLSYLRSFAFIGGQVAFFRSLFMRVIGVRSLWSRFGKGLAKPEP